MTEIQDFHTTIAKLPAGKNQWVFQFINLNSTQRQEDQLMMSAAIYACTLWMSIQYGHLVRLSIRHNISTTVGSMIYLIGSSCLSSSIIFCGVSSSPDQSTHYGHMGSKVTQPLTCCRSSTCGSIPTHICVHRLILLYDQVGWSDPSRIYNEVDRCFRNLQWDTQIEQRDLLRT